MKSQSAAAGSSIAFVSLLFATGLARAEAPASQAPFQTPDSSEAAELQARDDDTGEARGRDRKRKDAFQVGAVVGVGFPRPLAAEAMIKVQRWVAIGIEYSLFP